MLLEIKDLNELFEIFENMQVSDYQFDSRMVKEESLFFALRGEKVDGHSFLKEIAKKAKAAVVEEEILQPMGIKLFKVRNVIEAMQFLAKKKLEKTDAIKIGVTGSIGKTTTKEFIATLIGRKVKVVKTEKSYNSQRALPLSILNFKMPFQVALMEMGMSKKGEMGRLVEIVKPDIAIVTKVEMAHFENFSSLEEIAHEKAQIFRQGTKVKIINHDLFKFQNVFKKGEYLSFSTSDKKADFYLEKKGDKILIHEDKKVELDLPFQEDHLLENFLASYVISRHFVSIDEIRDRARDLKPVKMRFEKVKLNEITFIKDCYNANAVSVKAAFKSLPKVSGRKIAVLADMLGLGGASEQLHREIGKIANEHVDVIFATEHNINYTLDEFKKEKYFFKDLKAWLKN